MKNLFLSILVLLSFSINSQIVYIDNHDEVLSKSLTQCTGSSCPPKYTVLDIEKDDSTNNILTSPGNIRFQVDKGNFGPYSCTNENAPKHTKYCIPIKFDVIGKNLIMFNVYKNDTIDYRLLNNNSFVSGSIIAGGTFTNQVPGLCIGELGLNRLGFAINKTDPSTGKSGYLYGYIEYTLLSIGDIVIHGWYYNKKYNEPIIVNSEIGYPYNGCVYEDTIVTEITKTIYDTMVVEIPVIIYDTVEVNITNYIYDTIKIEIPVTIYDTIYVTIYDTVTIRTPLKVKNIEKIDIKVYPNPTSDIINIESSDIINANILLIDNIGKVVLEESINSNNKSIYIKGLSEGRYNLIIENGNYKATKYIQIFNSK